MERPALQRMLADINQGLIDITNRVFSDRPGALPRRYAACLCVPEPYPPRHIAGNEPKSVRSLLFDQPCELPEGLGE